MRRCRAASIVRYRRSSAPEDGPSRRVRVQVDRRRACRDRSSHPSIGWWLEKSDQTFLTGLFRSKALSPAGYGTMRRGPQRNSTACFSGARRRGNSEWSALDLRGHLTAELSGSASELIRGHLSIHEAELRDAAAHPTSPIELVLEVTTPPAGWSPGPAARAHWGRWGGLLEASFRTTSLNATCGGLCVAATCQLASAEQKSAVAIPGHAHIFGRRRPCDLASARKRSFPGLSAWPSRGSSRSSV